MTIEVRAARADEMDQFGLIGAYVYARRVRRRSGQRRRRRTTGPSGRCARSSTARMAAELFVPADARCVRTARAVAMGGVSAVGTLPEYRRQGLVARDHDALVRRHARARPGRRRVVGVAGGHLPTLWLRARRARRSPIASTRSTSAFATATAVPRASQRIDVDDGFDVLKKLYVDFVGERTGYLHRASRCG